MGMNTIPIKQSKNKTNLKDKKGEIQQPTNGDNPKQTLKAPQQNKKRKIIDQARAVEIGAMYLEYRKPCACVREMECVLILFGLCVK